MLRDGRPVHSGIMHHHLRNAWESGGNSSLRSEDGLKPVCGSATFGSHGDVGGAGMTAVYTLPEGSITLLITGDRREEEHLLVISFHRWRKLPPQAVNLP